MNYLAHIFLARQSEDAMVGALLGSYKDFSAVRIAVSGISQRLSRNGERLRASLVDLEENYEALAGDFHVFFPELMRFAERERARCAGQSICPCVEPLPVERSNACSPRYT